MHHDLANLKLSYIFNVYISKDKGCINIYIYIHTQLGNQQDFTEENKQEHTKNQNRHLKGIQEEPTIGTKDVKSKSIGINKLKRKSSGISEASFNHLQNN